MIRPSWETLLDDGEEFLPEIPFDLAAIDTGDTSAISTVGSEVHTSG